jgi:SpoVK/Ycf46/Vps4 family AAA+-type ATPase
MLSWRLLVSKAAADAAAALATAATQAAKKKAALSTVVHVKSWQPFAMELCVAAVPMLAASRLVKYMVENVLQHGGGMEDKKKQKRSDEAQRKLRKKLEQSGHADPGAALADLNKWERRVLADVVFPCDIRTQLADIGGLAQLKRDIHETIVMPLLNPQLLLGSSSGSGSGLLKAPKGALLYGPPGTGKTMMARAIARSSGATFINFTASSCESKYFGESEKMVRAVFSVARRLCPAVIFIDELDVLFHKRGGGGGSSAHEARASIKGEWMTQWDGLLNNNNNSDAGGGVCVLGATNRPYAIDAAILRRMPRQFLFALPDAKQRVAILRVILKGTRLHDDVRLEHVAQATRAYSGSDLRELCRFACMLPLRELIRAATSTKIHGKPRAVSHHDFVQATRAVRPAGAAAQEYKTMSKE